MRVLLLMRGAPGCGKSTFIDSHGLRPYALSADEIRLLCQSPKQTVEGTTEISTENESTVWQTLFKILDIRMKKGEFTVIDATNSKTVEMNRYKEMCDTYRYRMFCIDFTDLPIEECKRRNAQRIPLKQVPEACIDKMYSRFKNQKIPSGIKVIKPEELDSIYIKQFNMSEYDKIVHVGDIHGCYTALMEYFKDGFKDNYFYIFVGDIIDRGLENAEVVKFFIEAVKRKNVLLIEGNHEKFLQIAGCGGVTGNREFDLITKKQIFDSGIEDKDLRALYRKVGQCAWYKYDDKEVFVSHAGIATMPENLTFMATSQMINGVGSYNEFEAVAETWMNTTPDNYYQVYGHRNTKRTDIRIRDRVFNLEGNVEYGGFLRILELDHNGFNEISIKNDVYKEPEVVKAEEQVINSSTAEALIELRHNKYINEKQFGKISSFNFNKTAFYEGVWNKQTIVARGLYIDTDKMKVACRGFSKFFNVNEMPFTKLEMLQYKLQFPITLYVKENGFLGLVSYNEYTDDLFIATKSTINSDFSTWLKNMLYEKASAESIERIKQICKEKDVTFVFECVDMTHDPHVIDYPESNLYLLTIVKNAIQFAQFEYDQVKHIGEDLGISVKEKAFEIATWQDFYDLYTEVLKPDYTYNGRIIEGFVIEDSAGFMTKLKLTYYHFWKMLRSVAAETFRKGYITRTGKLDNAESNNFYAWCQNIYKTHTKEELEVFPKDIVTLRKMYVESQK